MFTIPGLIFFAEGLAWLLGGSELDAWKNNPAAQVTAWDRKIADAKHQAEFEYAGVSSTWVCPALRGGAAGG